MMSRFVFLLHCAVTLTAATTLVRPLGAQRQPEILKADDPDPGDRFGSSIAIAGTTLFVGAPDRDESLPGQGAVYVFEERAGVRRRVQKLRMPDATRNAGFGWGLAAEGNTLVVAAPGAMGQGGLPTGGLYVFVRDSSTSSWEWRQTLRSPFASVYAWFGWAVDLDIVRGRLVVGAPFEFRQGVECGAVAIYEREAETWYLQSILEPKEPEHLQEFGISTSIDGDSVLIGSQLDPTPGGTGSASLYSWNGRNWTFETRFESLGGAAGSLAGARVALEGNWAMVSDPGGGRGMVQVHRRSLGGDWEWFQLVETPFPSSSSSFGFGLALSGDQMIVGDVQDRNQQAPTGRIFAYRFDRARMQWLFEWSYEPDDPRLNQDVGRVVALEGKTVVLSAEHAGKRHSGAAVLLQPELFADPKNATASEGAWIVFEVDFGPASAGRSFALLASTERGRRGIGTVQLPLGSSELLDAFLSGRPPGEFTGAHGRLDGLGRAKAIAEFEPDVLARLPVDHMFFAAVRATAGVVDAASNEQVVSFAR